MLDQNLLNSEDNDNNHISSTRRRNNEASKRFRDRKRAQIKANEITIKQLYQTINRLNDKVKQLTIENKYWKLQIKELTPLKNACTASVL